MKKSLPDFFTLTVCSAGIVRLSNAIRKELLPFVFLSPKTIVTVIPVCLLLLSFSVQAQTCASSTAGLTPTATNDAVVGCYGSSLTISHSQLLSNDAGPNGSSITLVGFTQPSSGTIREIGSNLIFTPAPNFTGTVTFTYSIKKNDGYFFFNGHYYKLDTRQEDWNKAKAEAAKLSYNGRRGYLATITSQEENDFIKTKMATTNAWTGASDYSVEGEWKWMTGPENGTALGFRAWGTGKPEGGDGGLLGLGLLGSSDNSYDFMGFANGTWADFTSSTKKTFLVEYGGLETGCLPVVNATATVTITVNGPLSLNVSQSSTCNGGSIGSVKLAATGGSGEYNFDYLKYAFTEASIDATLFETMKGNFTVNGDLKASPVSGTTQYDNSISTKEAYTDNGFLRAEASFKFSPDATAFFGLTPTVPRTFGSMPMCFSFNQGYLSYMINGTSYNFGSYDTDTWYDFRIEKKGSVVKFYSKKSEEIGWTLLGQGTYSGTATGFKLAAQYYDDASTTRTFNSKNWLLSFNPPTSGLSAGHYIFTIKDESGCTSTASVNVFDNLPYTVNVAAGFTSRIGACDGSVTLTSPANDISYIATESYSDDFATALNSSLYNILNGVFSAGTDLRADPIQVSTGWGNSLTTSKTFTDKGFLRYEASYKFDANAQVFLGFTSSAKSILNMGDHLISFYYANGKLNYYINGAPLEIGAYAANVWFDFKIEKLGKEVRFYTRKQNQDWVLVAKENYKGTETSFKAGAQYYGVLGSNGGFNSRNWKVLVTGSTSSLCQGDYAYEVGSVGGCSSNVAFSIFDPVTTNAFATDATCYGYSNGNIVLTTEGGRAPYSYSVDNGVKYATSNIFEGLAAGTYHPIVKDAVGNTSPVQSVVVGQPDAVVAKISASGPLRFCDGNSVDLVASGGMSYKWNTGDTTSNVLAKASNTYILTAVDDKGCFGTSAPVTVTVFPLPEAAVSLSGSASICEGASVTLTGSDATSYLWSNGENTKSISVNTGGDYSVKVTDANGCSSVSDAVTVVVNPLPVVTIKTGGPLEFCQGGSVELVASGGEYYTWTSGEVGSSVVASTSGTLSVKVVDENGCSSTSAPITINLKPIPASTVTTDGPTNFCAGRAVVLAASNAASYLWNNGATTSSIPVTSSGDFYVTVTGENGCSVTSSTVSVQVNPLPVAKVTASGPTAFCSGSSVNLVASGGTSYLWSNGATSSTLPVDASGNYSVTVTDASGCSATSTAVPVTVNPSPVVTVAASGPTTFCEGGFVSLTATGGGTYLWSNGSIAPTLLVMRGGTYSVKVTSSNGCSTSPAPVSITVNPLPTATINVGSTDNFLCSGLTLSATSSTNANSYLWNNGATTQSIVLNSSSANGSYNVKVTDNNGCTSASWYYFWMGSFYSNYMFNKEEVLNAYTMLGLSSVNLGTGTTVKTGSVGVTAINGRLTIGQSTTIASPGAFAKAKTITITTPINVPNRISSAATNIFLPVMQNNTTGAASSYGTGTLSGTVTNNTNYRTLTIKAGATATLGGNIFGSIIVEQGAIVNFTNTAVSIDKLTIGSSTARNTSALSLVRFADNSSVKISTSVIVYGRSRVNAEERKVTFFLGDASVDAETFTVNGLDIVVAGTIYIPTGTLSVTGTDAATATTSTYMTGLFIAQNITSAGTKVIWQSPNCTTPASGSSSINSEVVEVEQASSADVPVTERLVEDLKLTVMPNPSTTEFTLVINSSSNARVTINIMDGTGRMIQQLPGVVPGSKNTLGGNFAAGSYYVQVIQGERVTTGKLIKTK